MFDDLFKAPSQPPANIAWKLTGSKLRLNWEHVKTVENESEVLGYKVSTELLPLTHTRRVANEPGGSQPHRTQVSCIWNKKVRLGNT